MVFDLDFDFQIYSQPYIHTGQKIKPGRILFNKIYQQWSAINLPNQQYEISTLSLTLIIPLTSYKACDLYNFLQGH